MREIEFRGQNESTKKWVKGLLFFSHGTGIYKITYSNGWTPSYSNPDEGESTIYTDVIPETIGQYTGLKDKNGTKIFEGDQLYVCNGYSSTVKFIDGMFVSVYEHREDGEVIPLLDVIGKDTIVIGNIHDNPELLK